MRLPDSFLLSLAMVRDAVNLANKPSKVELALPNNPIDSASYVMIFIPPNSKSLKDSLMIRITNTPQPLTALEASGISPWELTYVVSELKKVYSLGVPPKDNKKHPSNKLYSDRIMLPDVTWFPKASVREQLALLNVRLIRPYEGPGYEIDVAAGFEEILKQNGVTGILKRDGLHSMYKPIVYDYIVFETLS